MKAIENYIYHIITENCWHEVEGSEFYSPVSLKEEGFIHFSFKAQVASVAGRYYKDLNNLLLLKVKIDQLSAPLKVEASGADGNFPHVYGKLNLNALEGVFRLEKAENGAYVWEE
jgi:uncharacterized protein (DUF952 family)